MGKFNLKFAWQKEQRRIHAYLQCTSLLIRALGSEYVCVISGFAGVGSWAQEQTQLYNSGNGYSFHIVQLQT